MRRMLPFTLVLGVLLLAGCSSPIRTIEAKDGKVTMTEQRGGKVTGWWELKQVLSKEEIYKLRKEGWAYDGVVHNQGGPDTYLLQRRLSPPVPVVKPAFQPLLITTYGTNTSSDGTWRIGVSATTLDFTILGEAVASSSISSWSSGVSQEWQAKAGWFVFVESTSHVWAYDGDHQLLLEVETPNPGNGPAGGRGGNYLDRYPCAVPDEVFSRLSERKQQELRAAK